MHIIIILHCHTKHSVVHQWPWTSAKLGFGFPASSAAVFGDNELSEFRAGLEMGVTLSETKGEHPHFFRAIASQDSKTPNLPLHDAWSHTITTSQIPAAMAPWLHRRLIDQVSGQFSLIWSLSGFANFHIRKLELIPSQQHASWFWSEMEIQSQRPGAMIWVIVKASVTVPTLWIGFDFALMRFFSDADALIFWKYIKMIKESRDTPTHFVSLPWMPKRGQYAIMFIDSGHLCTQDRVLSNSQMRKRFALLLFTHVILPLSWERQQT